MTAETVYETPVNRPRDTVPTNLRTEIPFAMAIDDAISVAMRGGEVDEKEVELRSYGGLAGERWVELS